MRRNDRSGGFQPPIPGGMGAAVSKPPTPQLRIELEEWGTKMFPLLVLLGTLGATGLAQTKEEGLAEVFSLLRSESYAEAARSLDALVRTVPSDASLQNLLGTTRERAGETARAPSCYLRALQLRPGWSTARLNLALSYLRLGQRSAAAGPVSYTHLTLPTKRIV